MKKLVCVLALSSAFASFDALAWGHEGHRVVGSIAQKLIKGSNAEKQVQALLLPGETLESITNWADEAKAGVGYPAATPEQAEYTAVNPKHDEYHYVNIPFQSLHYHHGHVGTTEHDIVQTLSQAIAVLQGKTGPGANPHNFTRRQALLLIAHMTGDIHQPLHVGAAYVGKDGSFVVPKSRAEVDAVNIFDSRGGNNLLLDDDKLSALSKALIPGEDKPLPEGAKKWTTRPFHSYWDSTLVNYAMRRIATKTPDEFAQKVLGNPDNFSNCEICPVLPINTATDPSIWPYEWANDSLEVAKRAYDDVKPGKITAQTNRKGETYYTFNLETTPNYPVPSSAIAKTQLIKGGHNLAAVLKAIWP
ncbi:S1/P1 nuclease [Massilia sp. RP-1-19]|uniref:S1/P1 nuclease n=1 Tax=Massilia polaris TaxID=2728846 RepID=A0A848HL59_9BURK|nr:S1/P1 nuclease [Massilia polaris]NML62626.1 S1/P1 nuclease [Massilia polaris]